MSSLGDTRMDADHPGQRCCWCRRKQEKLYNYVCLSDDIIIWSCSWMCTFQLRDYRAKRTHELDTLIALGHVPRRLPKWYMDRPTFDSLIDTYRRLNQPDQADHSDGNSNDERLEGVNEQVSEPVQCAEVASGLGPVT